MRLALMIEGQEGVSWAEWLALAEACEGHGIEALFRSDHYLSGTDPSRAALDAWTTLAGLAARTERLALGTLVSPITFRHAAVLANASATANEISGGRVTLGMGAGWMEPEHEAFGFPFPPTAERLRMLSDQIEAVRGFWGEGTRPALVVGGAAKRGTVDPAARHADEYNTTFATPEECRKRRERVAAACRAHGREPIPFSLMTACAIGRDEAEVRDRIRRRIQRLGIDAMDADDWMAQRGDVAIVGTVEQAAERLHEYEAAGLERVMLQHLDHTDLDMVALIGRELAPAVTA